MGFFHNHEMFSYVAGCKNVTYSELTTEGVKAMQRFETEENLENFELIANIQGEQRFFVEDLELTLAEHDIKVIDSEDDLDMDFDNF